MGNKNGSTPARAIYTKLVLAAVVMSLCVAGWSGGNLWLAGATFVFAGIVLPLFALWWFVWMLKR